MPPPYRHGEAFALMTYRSDDGSEEETIWNSRDGVTPFVVSLRSGKQATHADWTADQRTPEDFTPPPGMRYFADLTAERAREHAEANVTRWLADPGTRDQLLGQFGTAGDAIDHLAADYLSNGPGAPDLIDPAPPEAGP